MANNLLSSGYRLEDREDEYAESWSHTSLESTQQLTSYSSCHQQETCKDIQIRMFTSNIADMGKSKQKQVIKSAVIMWNKSYTSSLVGWDVIPETRYFLRIWPLCVTSTFKPLRAFLIWKINVNNLSNAYLNSIDIIKTYNNLPSHDQSQIMFSLAHLFQEAVRQTLSRGEPQ